MLNVFTRTSYELIVCVYLITACYSVLTLDIGKNIFNKFKKDKADALGDLKRCRVTHSGVEYEGNIAQSKSGILCQNWETPDPIHKVAEQIVDTDFPEGSKKKAKNYCRNPRHWSGRPWCYTLDFNITDEECSVPLCAKKECRLTGPGVEYSGSTRYSGTRECLPWADLRGVEYKDILYNSLFPDGSRQGAKNKCRNPDSDPGGPWCYVQPDTKDGKSSSSYKKAYCGIPLCDPKPCMVATTAVSTGYQDYHTVFSLLPPNTTSLEFSVKLWHPDQWHSGELRLALAVYPLPTTGGHMRLWRTGIEVIISTYKSGLTPKGAEEPDWNVEPGLLSGTHWRDLELSWTGGFISLKVKGKAMAVFTKDYTGNENELSRGNFQFYSIKGSNSLWNFPSCSSDFVCEEHLTTHGDFERRWPLTKISGGFEVKFHVRGFHTAIIEMKSAGMLQYPSIQLTLVNSKMENKTTLTLKESPEDDRVTLEEVEIESLLSYWEWKEFSLQIDGPRLELLWFTADAKPSKLMSVMNSRFEFLKWFSIGSRQSTVHWTIGCSPPQNKRKISAEPPECVMSADESEFSGSQSVSATGLTCVPWADATGLITQEYADSSFVDGSKEDAKNYCRNPSRSDEGPYCFAADLADTAYVISKQNCSPRRCRSKECRMAGTGNDYIGYLGVTMTNRTCQRWTAKTPHAIPQKLVNKETFPELSVGSISNFCRNPTHDLAGPWCYTDDSALDIDICDVPDCDVLGSCTVIVRGNTTLQKIYILPLWKITGLVFKVKSWDPKYNEGIRLLVELEGNNTSYYRLDLGAGNNDKVSLTYTDSDGKDKVLKQKTVARVIPSGYWVGFVLTFGYGELSLKYENTPNPFFQWKHTFSEGVQPLRAKFISYSTLGRKYAVGMNFHCEEFHTYITQPGLVENMYPLMWWQPKHLATDTNVLRLSIRGAGTFVIVLIRLSEETSNRIILEISDYGQIEVKNKDTTLAEAQIRKAFNNLSWTNLTISLKEFTLLVNLGNKTVIDFTSKELLVFYFFSISVSDGFLTWCANCQPPNIDGPPVHGGWSSWGSWECSVTCGGGHGHRTRVCDRPKPNLIGEPCNGSDTMDGKCNDFKCGDVPPELYKEMATRITRQAHNIKLEKGERLQVQCDVEMLKKLKEASPSTKVEWIKDGILQYQEKLKNVTVNNVTVLKEMANLNDSGIYICGIEDRKKQRSVVQLTAVIVATNASTRSSRKGSTILLDCQVNPLTSLFSDLTQFWTLNGKLYQDYGAASHSLVDIDVLSPVTKSHEGVWECVVVQVQHNLSWTTTWFKLRVKKNSIFDVMFDQIFIGRYFRPFGDNVAWNSVVALVLFIVFVFVVSSIVFLARSRKKTKPVRLSRTRVNNRLVSRKTSKLKKRQAYQQLELAE